MAKRMAADVIGREEELGSIGAFLAEVKRGPRALVLAGEPGIGKTILWEQGIEDASGNFSHVLSCGGVEAEASLSFAGLSELLDEVLEEAGPALVAPRRRALEVALRLAEPGDDAPDNLLIGLAVLDVFQALAERGPVLVALDDMQWLDPSSAGVLQIAFRRLREQPVGVLATVRTAPEVSSPFELERAFPGERLQRRSLGPLSLGVLHRLLKERLGLELTRPELVRVREATAGNPFFALELGRELVRTGTRPAAGRELPVPESLRELLGERLARLPGETLDVLLQAAALARPTVDLVAATYGDRDRVLAAIEAAVREGVVELDDSRLAFSHPLLASICYEHAPVWKRRAVHRALAGAVTDVEERARHLALAAEGPDAVIASELDTAAEQAAARGAPATAAELCELAARLTPGDPSSDRKRRLQTAHFHRLAGNGERAAEMLELLLAEAPPGIERADVLLELASTERRDNETMIALCGEALFEVADDDMRSSRILTFRAGCRLRAGDTRGGLSDAREALERAERFDDPALTAAAIGRLGIAEAWAGENTPGLLERGAEIEKRLGLALIYYDSPRYPLVRRLARIGETDHARALLEDMESEASARGDDVSRAQIIWWLSLVEWLEGHLRRALDQAAAAYEIAEQTQYAHALMWIGRAKALIEADLGLVDEARASAAEAIAHSEATSSEAYVIVALGVLGRIELALGNLEASGNYLRDLPSRLLASDSNDPTLTVWADAIETLVALGELERAASYLEPYDVNAARLDSPWARTGAARCHGLLAAAEGNLEAAFSAFERSLDDAAPFPLERARTLLCLGTVRRRAQQKRSARDALEQALAVFEELGARLWAEKARAELRRISGRRATSDELTETERRVAELAAKGRTNKEIAAELYLGVSTVEGHLSRVYRKLGIRSRTELTSRLPTAAGGGAKLVDEAAQV
jgi:ATP/maltotriose-dependent transcriptional regulator MalT